MEVHEIIGISLSVMLVNNEPSYQWRCPHCKDVHRGLARKIECSSCGMVFNRMTDEDPDHFIHASTQEHRTSWPYEIVRMPGKQPERMSLLFEEDVEYTIEEEPAHQMGDLSWIWKDRDKEEDLEMVERELQERRLTREGSARGQRMIIRRDNEGNLDVCDTPLSTPGTFTVTSDEE